MTEKQTTKVTTMTGTEFLNNCTARGGNWSAKDKA